MKKPVAAITLLVGVYIALQMTADVAAAKIVDIGGITLPGGTFVFALTFTWRDVLHKRLGKAWAQAAIYTAALANIGMALYFAFAIQLPAAGFWPLQDAFASILGVVPRIAVASILAELFSELADTEVYHWAMHRIGERHQWARVAISNAVSLPLDSLIFATLAFAGTMPMDGIVSIILGQIAFKAVVTVISLPLIYTVKENEQPFEVVPATGD